MAAVANQALAAAHATSAALTLTSDGTAADTWSIVPVRAKDIFVAVIGANTERKPLGLGSAWPRSAFTPIGHGMDADIAEMTFANSSDYFTALIDGHRIGKDDWSPFVVGLDWTTFAGGGVPPKEGAGRLTAANNIWTVAANVTDDMPDVIPVLVSRNVDPSSLVPGGDDLKASVCTNYIDGMTCGRSGRRSRKSDISRRTGRDGQAPQNRGKTRIDTNDASV
jgi:hypothetical protein